MELVSTKILVLTLLGALRLCCGLLPLKITRLLTEWGDGRGARHRQVDTAISLCLCFGGGVLLATCFIHMIPEVRDSLELVKRSRDFALIAPDNSFPLAELLVCAGFFLVYFLEELVHVVFVRTKRVTQAPAQHCSTLEPAAQPPPPTADPTCTAAEDPATSQLRLLASSLSLAQPADKKAVVDDRAIVGGLRNCMVVVALSFHSVFEGLAIGLQPTVGDVWYLFAAVSIHASTILFCTGLELATSGAKVLHVVVYVLVLATVSPLGVAFGILVSVNSASGSVVQTLVIAVLQSLAGGTILYITFFEVLNREKKKETGCGLVRIAFILLGFSLMVALQLAAGHDHVGDVQTASVTPRDAPRHGHGHGHGHSHDHDT